MLIEDLPPGKIPPRYRPPKVKIEFTDQKGAKYSFTAEGPSKDDVTKLMSFVESLSVRNESELEQQTDLIDTNFSKVFGLVQNKFRFGSFTSKDVLEAYEQYYQLPTTLSTVSTYLARLSERGLLYRKRNGSGWTYKLIRQQEAEIVETTPLSRSTQSSHSS